MSLTIPTDSLNKFLAVGSLVVLLVLLNISLANYEKAELSKIEALRVVLKYENSCEEFCNKMKELSRELILFDAKLNKLKKVSNKDANTVNELHKLQKENEKFIIRLKEIEPLKKKALDLDIDKQIAIKKMNFFYNMRNIWLGLSIFLCIVFTLTASIGFFGWYKSEKK